MSDLVDRVRHLIPEGLVPGTVGAEWMILPGYMMEGGWSCGPARLWVSANMLLHTERRGKWWGPRVVKARELTGDPTPVREWCQKYGATVCADHGWVVVQLPEPLFCGGTEGGELDSVVAGSNWGQVYKRLTTEVMRWEVVGP